MGRYGDSIRICIYCASCNIGYSSEQIKSRVVVMTKRISVKHIVLSSLLLAGVNAQGKVCPKLEAANDYAEAEEILTRMSETMPKSEGYDTCDFTVTFDDGNTYVGTFALYHKSVARNLSLKEHIGDYCRYAANLVKPAHLNDEMWAKAKEVNSSTAHKFISLVENYDV